MSDDLTDLVNVGPARADRLRAAGFENAADVKAASVDELTKVDQIGEELAEAILDEIPAIDNPGHDSRFPDVAEELLESAKLPKTKTGIARDAGITYRTLNNYLNEFPEFAAEFRRRRGEAEAALLMTALGDPIRLNELLKESGEDLRVEDDMVRWLLSRSYGYVKTEKHEVESDSTLSLEGDGFTVEFNE